MSTTPPIDQSAFLALPLELRLDIYDLVFASDSSTPAYVNLLEASPAVDRSLLTTCRQINQEAQRHYRSACRHYWKHNRFAIEFNVPIEKQLQPLCERIRTLPVDERSLALLSDVEIVAIDQMEMMSTRERKQLRDGTSKAELIKMATDFHQKFDLLLYKQWYEDFFVGRGDAYA